MKPAPPTLPSGRCLTDIWDDVRRTPALRHRWLAVVQAEADGVRLRAAHDRIRKRPRIDASLLLARIEDERRQQAQRSADLQAAAASHRVGRPRRQPSSAFITSTTKGQG